MEGKCLNCCCQFQSRSKGYARYALTRKIKGTETTAGEALEQFFGVSPTPCVRGKVAGLPSLASHCLCNECFRFLSKVVCGQHASKNAQNAFRQMTHHSGYLSDKLACTPKRKMEDRTPQQTPRAPKVTKNQPENQVTPMPKPKGFKAKSMSNIQNGNYYTAFNILAMRSPRAREQLIKLAARLIKRECVAYKKSAIIPKQPLSLQTMEAFSWPAVMSELRAGVPSLSSLLENALKPRRRGEKTSSMQAGHIILSILFIKFPRTFKFFQQCNSLQLFRHGNSHVLEAGFNKLAMSLGIKGTRSTATNLHKETMQEADRWKSVIEGDDKADDVDYMPRSSVSDDESEVDIMSESTIGYDEGVSSERVDCSTEHPEHPELLQASFNEHQSPASTIPYLHSDSIDTKPVIHYFPKARRRCFFSPPDEEPHKEDDDPSHDLSFPGYSIVWDNVGKMITRAHQNTQQKNIYAMFAMTMLVQNRVSFREWQDVPFVTRPASTIPLSAFMPSCDDWSELRNRMEILVSRILVKHVPNFTRLSNEICAHIPHEYAAESAQKSVMLNTGVIKADPASAKGVVQIMKKLKDYVPLPDGPAGEPYVIPCHGDQLSVERMVDARFAMGDHELTSTTLKGLEPWPGEFHNRCIHLQDTMDQLFKGCSGAQRGTLFHIKNKFGHRTVKKNVMENVQHVYDLIDFTTDSIVCMSALKIQGLKSVDKLTLPVENTQHHLANLSKAIVDLLWPAMRLDEDTLTVDNDRGEDDDDGDDGHCDDGYDDQLYCYCKRSANDSQFEGSTMVECSAQSHCHNGRWFHLQCLEDQPDSTDGDWWCSQRCSSHSIYCLCKENKKRPSWMQCTSKEHCIKSPDGWFHRRCVNTGIKSSGTNRSSWYCSLPCQQGKSPSEVGGKDHIKEYTCALGWQGLFHRVRMDAEHENDGKFINTLWRLSMINLWNNNHYKYLILGHRVTSATLGCINPRVSLEMTWNRTANTKGQVGRNVALDMKCEHCNKDFQEALRIGHGHFSEEHVKRISTMVGTTGKFIDNLYVSKVACTYSTSGTDHKAVHSPDVMKFLQEYARDRLLDVIPGREHPAFPRFTNKIHLDKPDKLMKRLSKYSKVFDAERMVLDLPR